MTKGRAIAAAAAALIFLIISQTASAQYPPPQGSLICALAQSQVSIDSNITMTVRLIDTSGNSMYGQYVTFSLISSNGTATLSPTSATTDGNGQASTTVYVGTGAGTIQVQASTGVVACSSSFVITAPSPPPYIPPPPPYIPPPPPYSPPPVNPCDYSPGSSACCSYDGSYAGCVRSVTIIVPNIIQPPNTGDAGLASTGKHTVTGWYIIGGVEVGILLLLSTWLISSQIRGRPGEARINLPRR